MNYIVSIQGWWLNGMSGDGSELLWRVEFRNGPGLLWIW